MADNKVKLETQAVHSGQDYKQWRNKEITPPIVTSVTYHQDDPSHASVR